MKKINTFPFEIMGVTYDDYVEWCNNHQLNPKKKENKKEFFRKLHKYEMRKVNGKLIEGGLN